MDRQSVSEAFAIMRAAWPSAELFRQDKQGQAQSITLWARMAADIPADVGKATVLQLVASRKFPPSISEFLEAARAKLPRPELEAHEAPTLEEGMRMVRFLRRIGGLEPGKLPEPYRGEYERRANGREIRQLQ